MTRLHKEADIRTASTAPDRSNVHSSDVTIATGTFSSQPYASVSISAVAERHNACAKTLAFLSRAA